MLTDSQKWDKLSAKFDTHKDGVDPDAADNIVIAWPVVLELLEKHGTKGARRVLDFGCGTGGFCNELAKQGYSATGLDFSKQMIAAAKLAANPKVDFHVGGCEKIEALAKHDAITSIMVLQFVESLDEVAKAFANGLQKNGIVVAAVVHPDFVKACLDKDVNFHGWNESKKTASIGLSAEFPLTVFVRDAKEYTKAFEKAGFELIEVQSPPFPPGFAEQYGWMLPTEVPEFLIIAFRKKPTTLV